MVLILNPYTIFGPFAYFVAIPFLLYSFINCFKYFDKKILLIFLIMIFISFIGVLSSYIHGIEQYEHLKVSISIPLYVLIGYGLYLVSYKNNISFNDICFIALLAIFFNSIIILIEVSYPSFRELVESFLVGAGNRDWTEGFRYRGIASSGGASLSVLHAMGVVLLLYLVNEKYLSVLKTSLILFPIILSIFFIGRTGLVFIGLAILLFTLFSKKNIQFFVFLLLFFISIYLFFDELVIYLTEIYGEGFYNYSLGFLVEGREGIEDEGTVSAIHDFLKVMPVTFPEVLIGYGFYGGSDFHNWTDSGYSRMFLSVGYFFGITYYLCFLLLLKRIFLFKKSLFVLMIPLILLAEAKEALLFSGYSSRLLFIIIGFVIMEKRFNLKDKVNT